MKKFSELKDLFLFFIIAWKLRRAKKAEIKMINEVNKLFK